MILVKEESYAMMSSARVNGRIYHMLIFVLLVQANRFARGDEDWTVNIPVCESLGQRSVSRLKESNRSQVHGGK